MANEKLTPKQKLFVEHFLENLNATQAAIKAGYSKKTAMSIGSENLGKPEIMAAIKHSLGKKFEKAGIDGQWVIDRLVELVDRCMQKKPVMVRRGRNMVQKTAIRTNPDTGEEFEVGVWEFDSSGANGALEKLGKYFKLFVEQHEHKHSFVSEGSIYDEEYEDDTE